LVAQQASCVHIGKPSMWKRFCGKFVLDRKNPFNKGSKPEDLVITPPHLFLEAPSAASMENVHGTIARSAAALRVPAPKPGPAQVG
jgi:hypothetical protein